MNGLAFVATLRAKQLPKSESTNMLHNILKMEIEAYNLVSGPMDMPHIYLRFNLLVNIAFLLEILGEYEQAIRFWKEYAKNIKKFGPEVDEVLGYRLGLVFFKAGRHGDAKKALASSLAGARSDLDKFSEERILYALGYVYLKSGENQKAMSFFEDGLKLALELEWNNASDHIIGLAHSGAQLERSFLTDYLLKTIPQKSIRTSLSKIVIRAINCVRLGDSSIPKTLDDAGLKLKPPSPKLPSYIASVDLEPVPSTDVNRYLVSPLSYTKS